MDYECRHVVYPANQWYLKTSGKKMRVDDAEKKQLKRVPIQVMIGWVDGKAGIVRTNFKIKTNRCTGSLSNLNLENFKSSYHLTVPTEGDNQMLKFQKLKFNEKCTYVYILTVSLKIRPSNPGPICNCARTNTIHNS